MPSGPDAFDGQPDWVISIGCVFEGRNRVCLDCDRRWFWAAEQQDVKLWSFADLCQFADAESVDDLANWISESTELDALVRPAGDGLWSVGFDDIGTVLEFPLTLADFWELVEDQEDEAVERLEAEEEE